MAIPENMNRIVDLPENSVLVMTVAQIFYEQGMPAIVVIVGETERERSMLITLNRERRSNANLVAYLALDITVANLVMPIGALPSICLQT
ncbi:hypothetical protein DGG96_08395 [Legionella qingyii]|uniref:Uncharacterized protein n=1 Tax=Legionella qingyii TaxID=2184757 RepID=A0A317U6K0_9GAMM|nr:hypothetical protein [Legionella qingyii]PWY56152.1 hypothetical protein DGG96_08395 [Legionella qingyii]